VQKESRLPVLRRMLAHCWAGHRRRCRPRPYAHPRQAGRNTGRTAPCNPHTDLPARGISSCLHEREWIALAVYIHPGHTPDLLQAAISFGKCRLEQEQGLRSCCAPGARSRAHAKRRGNLWCPLRTDRLVSDQPLLRTTPGPQPEEEDFGH
jgi:hypothetical protein